MGTFIAAIIFLVSSVLVMPWDLALSKYFRQDFFQRGDIGKTIAVSEAYAHAAGAVAIFVSLLVVDRANRRMLWFAVLLAAMGGIAGNWGKVVFPRYRPAPFDEYSATMDEIPSTWMPSFSVAMGDWAHTSFPSGHAAHAAGLTVGLILVYPRGIYVFLVLATVAGLQRIVAGAHFPSDVCGGASVGCFASALGLQMMKWTAPSIADPNRAAAGTAPTQTSS